MGVKVIMPTNKYVFPRGYVMTAPYTSGLVVGPSLGLEKLGNTPQIDLSQAVDELEHEIYESGEKEIDESMIISVDRDFTIKVDNITDDILSWFVLGDKSTIIQASGSVSDEKIENVVQGQYYQLGRSVANPSGARNLSEIAVTKDADARASEENYSVGDYIKVATEIYRCKTAGKTAAEASIPSFVHAEIGDETTDGTAVWEYVAPVACTVNVDYTIDAVQGVLKPIVGGGIPSSYEDSAHGLHLVPAYTKAAANWTRITNALRSGTERVFQYIASNPTGSSGTITRRNIFIPRLKMVPDGNLPLHVTQKNWQELGFKCRIMKPHNPLLKSLYIDGQAVA